MPSYKNFKQYANTIVGYWFNEKTDEVLVFDLNDKLGQPAKLIMIQQGKTTKGVYSIGIHPLTSEWYFDTGYSNKVEYIIIALTPMKMTLRTSNGSFLEYVRRTSEDFADDILKELN
jgi:hypothetical protein